MSYTKRQFIFAAFEEIGLASYVFDLQSEDLQSSLRRLDAMMAEWNAKGLRLSYPIPSSPELSELNTETNVPDYSNEAIILGLAVRIAPSYGKILQRDTKVMAKNAYETLFIKKSSPPQMQFNNTLPRGAGNKPWREEQDNFTRTPLNPVDESGDGVLEYN